MVGGVEVIPICDAVGPMGEAIARPNDEMFGGATDGDWAWARAAHPGAFGPRGEWVLRFHCFLLRDGSGNTALVDAGIGPSDSPAATWAPVPGRLLGELAAAGVDRHDVGTVIVTHLHSDHAGGLVTDGVPTFPNARHVLQRAELDWIEQGGPGPMRERVLHPLTGLVDAVEGRARVLPDVVVEHAPGHTPGHQVVTIGPLTLTGDVILHPVQLADPGVTYRYDDDRVRAAETRRALLARVRAAGGTLAPAHFPEPFVERP
jgi:glyoxylase-like metal-dependent hydrolase (beta-lactamase superfamily II)